MRYDDKAFYESRFFYADAAVFDVFTFPLLRGSPRTALAYPFSVVITEEMAEKYFATENPIGRTLQVENHEDYKITGVMRNVPNNSHFQFDFLASFETLPSLESRIHTFRTR